MRLKITQLKSELKKQQKEKDRLNDLIKDLDFDNPNLDLLELQLRKNSAFVRSDEEIYFWEEENNP